MGRIGADAIRKLGRESAAITAEAAAKGALSNSRIVFSYTDALEQCWKCAADEIMAELRRWTAETKVGRKPLRDAAESELRRLMPRMIEASRVRHAAKRFSNQVMLRPAVERIDALEGDLTFRLRQFDINMDVERPSNDRPIWRRTFSWVGEHLSQIMIGVVIAAIAAALGLSS